MRRTKSEILTPHHSALRLFLLPLIFSIVFANRTVKTFTFSTQGVFARNTPAGMVFNLPEGEHISPPGAPALPTIGITYPISAGNIAAGVKIVNVEYETLPGFFSVAPTQPPAILSLPPPKPVGRNQAIYDDINPYPKEICRLVGNGYQRRKPIASILINPLQFLPLEGRVRLIKKLDIALEYQNQRDKGKEWAENGPLEYLIVTNSTLDTIFAELLSWRHKTGFNGKIRLIEWITAHYPGRDEPEKLRNYLKICAQDSGLKWLLLGGDVEIIPVRKAFAMTCSAGIHPREDSLPCDLYYSDLDGNWDFNNNNIFGETADSVDLYPDIFVGRVPVKTPQEAR
ncbi:MAG: C25 family cysteine peptidase, partial [candidate division WOR-3 bacterium]